ncbi:MAG: ribosome maturation factor RimP [Legionellales bacterium]|nr:ribosome maturation factor RimP [Legionellales bacterium]|tara:strand:+ start:198 stop:653 length:456 start_codon:yes stop_codon:yes gene_type:complete
MNRQNQNLLDLFEPEVISMGYELLGVELIRNGNHSLLRVYIDKAGGIDIDDCALVSHQLTGLLEVKDPIKGGYNLEISSPGLDRPLFTENQIKEYVGEEIALKLYEKQNGRKNFVGILKAIDDIEITIRLDKNDEKIPLKSIEKAKLVPKF